MNATIYHNPKCGTSRNTLAILQRAGAEPTVIEYLKTPPDRAKLVELIALMGIPVRDVFAARAHLTKNWVWTIPNGPTIS
jgi:arsenate reductase